MRTTDFYDDVNQQTLYALDKLTGVPDFVKSATIETQAEIGQLPAHVFADPQHRKFPVHTKAATWLANAYFKHASAHYSTEERRLIQDRISKAASFWKIGSQVTGFNQQWDRLHVFHAPKDLPDEQYALIYKTAGHTIRKFPIPNAACVKLAGERLFADRHKYTFPMRKFAARRILRAQKQAKVQFQPETAEYLARAAGEGSAFPADIATKLAQRAIMVKRQYPDLAMKLAEIAEAIENEKILPASRLEKLAGLVDSVDQSTGLFRYYYEGVPMPEEFLYDIQEKEAQAFLDSHIQLQTGATYPLSQLKKLPLSKIAEVMGKEFADAVSANGKISWDKFAEIAPTLPRGDAKLLESIIKSAQESPAGATETLPAGTIQQLLGVLTNALDGSQNDVIPGGEAAGMPASAFPKDQLQEGTEEEQEHTSSPAVAQEIAKDHLTEAKDYYEPRLENMEEGIEADKAQGKTEGAGEEKEDEGEKKEARFDPAKLTGRNTEQLFRGMGADVEEADGVTDFKKIIRFKTKR